MLFIWHRFDISRSVFKDFIRITFVVMAPLEQSLQMGPLCRCFKKRQNLITKYKTASFKLLT